MTMKSLQIAEKVETVGIEPTRPVPRLRALKTPANRDKILGTNRPRAASTAGAMAQERSSPMHGDPIPVPLRDRTGATIAYAVLDQADAHLAEYRWYLDSNPARDGGKPYARRNGITDGKRGGVYMHREVLGLKPGDPRYGDHINGFTLDNRRANLRIVTNAENSQNRKKRSGTSSSYRGVTWDKARGKWIATCQGRHLGRFDSEQEAGRVAAEYRAQHMPFSREAA